MRKEPAERRRKLHQVSRAAVSHFSSAPFKTARLSSECNCSTENLKIYFFCSTLLIEGGDKIEEQMKYYQSVQRSLIFPHPVFFIIVSSFSVKSLLTLWFHGKGGTDDERAVHYRDKKVCLMSVADPCGGNARVCPAVQDRDRGADRELRHDHLGRRTVAHAGPGPKPHRRHQRRDIQDR